MATGPTPDPGGCTVPAAPTLVPPDRVNPETCLEMSSAASINSSFVEPKPGVAGDDEPVTMVAGRASARTTSTGTGSEATTVGDGTVIAVSCDSGSLGSVRLTKPIVRSATAAV